MWVPSLDSLPSSNHPCAWPRKEKVLKVTLEPLLGSLDLSLKSGTKSNQKLFTTRNFHKTTPPMVEPSVFSLFNDKEGREDLLIFSVHLLWALATCCELYKSRGCSIKHNRWGSVLPSSGVQLSDGHLWPMSWDLHSRNCWVPQTCTRFMGLLIFSI